MTRCRVESAVEAVVDGVPGGGRHGSEAKAGREQPHVDALPRECRRERVVVRGCVGGRVGDDDAHRVKRRGAGDRARRVTPVAGRLRACRMRGMCSDHAPVGLAAA